MEVNKIKVFIINNYIIIEDNVSDPFIEHCRIPIEDWEQVKNYIDNEIKSKATIQS
jgi:hypothetical protein